MSTQKPSIPKGTRDFSPSEMMKRNLIFETIKRVFMLYGYQPIETPAMENLSTLLGKYGEEGDKLLFRILNSGDFLGNVDDEELKERNIAKLATKISEKGLRYDLTVPFARYVVQYQNDITFPFKRYQIQPVWRADRPQKGRYREFYQCDIDVIGSDALFNEVELLEVIVDIFERLRIEIVIKLNNRKILAGVAEIIGESDRLFDITAAIDKIEKIGLQKVNDELAEKGISQEAIEKLQPVLTLSGTNNEKMTALKQLLKHNQIGLLGIHEMETVFGLAAELLPETNIELDLTLARGLDYYTGAIIEVKAKEVNIGSICGGGRYDDLTGIFGMAGISGVGISFGADRIFDVMNELKLFPEDNIATSKVLFVNFGEEEQKSGLKLVKTLRKLGYSAELYPEPAKMKKQMAYANKKKIPYVILMGKDEINNKVLTLRKMKTGEQMQIKIEDFIIKITNKDNSILA